MIDELRRECEALQHAMQSGVAMEIQLGNGGGADPKSLRVGVNSAMVAHVALCRVLIDKDIISEEEYWVALREECRREVARYEESLSRWLGRPITLH